MTVTLTAEEREALYEELYVGLTGIDAVWLAASSGDVEKAQELARRYCDDLRLLAEDLDWGEGAGESLELTAPPEVLHRVFTRLHEAAQAQRREIARERSEVEEREEQAQRLLATCERVLGAMSGG
jgi:hypothetical protein